MPISTDIILRKDSQHGAVLLKQVIYIDGDDDDGGGDLVGDSDDDANDENIIKTNSAKTSELWDPNFATKKVENDRD